MAKTRAQANTTVNALSTANLQAIAQAAVLLYCEQAGGHYSHPGPNFTALMQLVRTLVGDDVTG